MVALSVVWVMDVSQLPLNQIEATASNVRNSCYVIRERPLTGILRGDIDGPELAVGAYGWRA
jgi:hypothetical protein